MLSSCPQFFQVSAQKKKNGYSSFYFYLIIPFHLSTKKNICFFPPSLLKSPL